MALLPTNIQTLLIESLADMAPMVLAQEHPLLDRVSKGESGGSAKHVPIITGYGGGTGNDFATSLANAQSNVVTDVAFDVTPAVLYGHTTLNWTQSRYTRDRKSSPLDVATIATKGAMENAVDNFMKAAVLSDGTGTLATVSAATNVSGSVWDITLTNITDAGYFRQNMVLQQGTGGSLDAGTAVVNGINQIAGILRVTVTGMTPTATHVLGLQSQLYATTNFAGIFGFIPTVANRTNGVPNTSPFLGAVRDATSAGVAVSGWAFDLTGQPIFYGLNTVAGAMANYKHAKPKLMVINGADMPKLAQELDAKVRYDMPSRSGNANVLYSGFEMNLTTGACEVLAEPAMPAGYYILTNPDQWYFECPDQPFGSASEGQVMVQDYDSNNARFSVECSGFFYTNNPPATAVGKLY